MVEPSDVGAPACAGTRAYRLNRSHPAVVGRASRPATLNKLRAERRIVNFMYDGCETSGMH